MLQGVSRCVPCCAPSYPRDLCCPVSVLAVCRVLRTAARGELLVPRARLPIIQRRAFSVVGSSAWNDLPLSSVPCWWPPIPNFTSPSSPFPLAAIGLGAPPSSSSVLKRRYISLQNEWMNLMLTRNFQNPPPFPVTQASMTQAMPTPHAVRWTLA